MTIRVTDEILGVNPPSRYAHARPHMTRLGVSVDELSNLIMLYDIRAATARVHGHEQNEITYAGTADFLRSELRLHRQTQPPGRRRKALIGMLRAVRRLSRYLPAGLIALAAPVAVVCFLLGVLELGSAILG